MQKDEFLQLLQDPDVCREIFEVVRRGGKPIAQAETQPPELKAELNRIPFFSTGAAKGRSDLSAIKDGRVFFLEVKTKTGKASPEQLSFIDTMHERYGCTAGIVHSVEEAVELVGE